MEHHDCWIEMADGTRLAATIWLPDQSPAPCLLEALPYRKDDITASYGETYELLARHGVRDWVLQPCRTEGPHFA